MKSLHKKGAIQMSMQTIIVVVIGVTLLTLGLKFTYDTFGSISEKQQRMDELSQGELDKMFGGDEDPINLPKTNTEIKLGDESELKVTLVNTGEDDIENGGLKIEVAKKPDKAIEEDIKDWFLYDDTTYKFIGGKSMRNNVAINIPKTARIGTYILRFKFFCEGEDEDSHEVCGESQTLIMRLKA